MGLKTFKPYTKSTRGTVIVDKVHYGKVLLTNLSQEDKNQQAEEIIMAEYFKTQRWWSKT